MIDTRIDHIAQRSRKLRTLFFLVAMGVTISRLAFADENTFTAPLESFSALNERPLFAITRRPVEASSETPTAIDMPAPPPLEGTLLGLGKGDEGGGFAIVRLNDEAQPYTLHIGDMIRGWQLTAIDNHTAQFSKDEQTLSLSFP
jgi:hypothetical protein